MNTKERILNLIEKNFESDAAFERALQLKSKTVDNWRRNNSEAYLKILVELSECFNVSTDYLLGKTDDPTPSGVEPAKSESVKWENIRVTFYEGGEGEDLSDEEKEEILDLVKFARERRRKKREEKSSKER